MTYKIGDKVVKNPATWIASDFDGWRAGEGIGIVVEGPRKDDDDPCVDVRWPAGRCFQRCSELLPSPDA